MRILRHAGRHGLAYVALFAALGGTSFAAANALVARNSVGSAQVRDRSLLARDFKRGQLVKGPRGLQGLRGLTGPRGTTGAQGPAAAHPSFVTDGTTESPAAAPISTTFQTVSLTTSAAGGVFAQARLGTLYIVCGGVLVPCTIVLGLYVDGQPVPRSGLTLSSGCATTCSIGVANVALSGVAPGVSAGAHTVELAGKLTVGTFDSTMPGAIQLQAIGAG